jgi:hypothetical protein
MKNAILFVEHLRWEYFYISMTSLQRVKNIKNWDIIVSIDGKKDTNTMFEELCKKFNCIYWEWPDEVINKNHSIRSLDKAFETYDRILLMDGVDYIFRTDTVEYLNLANYSNYTFVNLGGWMPHDGTLRIHWFNPWRNHLERSSWIKIKKWIDDKGYVGEINPLMSNERLTETYRRFEALMARYCQNKLGTSLLTPNKAYVLHIGVVGYSSRDYDVHNKMISGDKDTWFDNTLNLFINKASIHFWPKDFVYG